MERNVTEMRSAYLDSLYQLAANDKRVFALISDNGAIVFDKFRKDLASQYLNLGISEANMLGMAAGMASCGKIPFAYTIGAFLAYRALEFIRNDICLQNQNVKIIGTGAGETYSALGPTHHSTEDMGGLRSMPNLVILSPASPMEVKKATMAAYKHKGPVYLRLGTNKELEIYDKDYLFEIGKGICLKEGDDISLIATGSILKDVLAAAEHLKKYDIDARVINMHTIKPIDEDIILKAAKETGKIITIEDHNIIGGLGSATAEVIAKSGFGILFRTMGLNTFSEGYGTYDEVKNMNGIGVEKICSEVRALIEND